jgi:hypothetical protein
MILSIVFFVIGLGLAISLVSTPKILRWKRLERLKGGCEHSRPAMRHSEHGLP